MAGFTKRIRWLQGLIKRAGLDIWQSQIPTAKTPHLNDLLRRLEYLTEGLKKAQDVYHRPECRRRRWGVWISKQRFLHVMCKHITRGFSKEEVVVGWGAASCGQGSCISRRGKGPHKELVRLLRRLYATVYIIDEFRTSQICNDCLTEGLFADRPYKDVKLRKANRTHVTNAYSLKVCPHCLKVSPPSYLKSDHTLLPYVWVRGTVCQGSCRLVSHPIVVLLPHHPHTAVVEP